MKIGFDLDNTLFDYKVSIRKALESDEKYSKFIFTSKVKLKQDMCNLLGPDAWTEFQGILYCDFLEFAFIDPFAVQVLQLIKEKNHHFFIVSHKTTRPIRGGDCLLRSVSDYQLKKQLSLAGFTFKSALPIRYYDSLAEKISAIKEINFDIFIDDLPEVIYALKGRVGTLIHYDENIDESKPMESYWTFRSWSDIYNFFISDNVL